MMAGMETRASRVVVVEDEMLIRHMIADVLSDHGFQVAAFANAKEALEHLTCGAPCDVLFTDINLPGSMTGAELARRARALMPELPVVYASGRYRGDDLGGLVPHSAFVPKPYDQRKLRHVLEQIAIGTAH